MSTVNKPHGGGSRSRFLPGIPKGPAAPPYRVALRALEYRECPPYWLDMACHALQRDRETRDAILAEAIENLDRLGVVVKFKPKRKRWFL